MGWSKRLSSVGPISQSIEKRNWEVMLQLYKTLVSPHFKYCVQFWSPCYRKDAVKLERVQRRFMRMLPELKGLSYRGRLCRIGPTGDFSGHLEFYCNIPS